MSKINRQTQIFLSELTSVVSRPITYSEQEVVVTSKTASTLATIYESARNAVEFKADHLIRQGAIERILKRRLFLNQSSSKLASLLIKELLWARYLKENSVPKSKIHQVAEIISKYRSAFDFQSQNKEKERKSIVAQWLLGLGACEIEEELVFNPEWQILSNYVFACLAQKIEFEEKDLQTKSMQIYIAAERGFAKSSEILISFHLLKSLLPDWFETEAGAVAEIYPRLMTAYQLINKQLNYPAKDKLRRVIVKMAPPFNLIRDLLATYPQEFTSLVNDPQLLKQKARNLLENRYLETKEKLNRASTRSIIYIFLTKMILGLSLELPFDLFIGLPNYLALGINAVFPVLLIFLLNINIKLPDQKNTERMIIQVNQYFFGSQEDRLAEIVVSFKEKEISRFFILLYLATYFVIFGGIVALLRWLHFNPVSQTIFLFFLCVVTFFAYRVRLIAKEYYLPEEGKEGFFASLIDFLFLPIIKVGQWLSIQISQLNILTFLLDFIIEAPLKAFLEVIESWLHFVRVKREEMVS